MKKGTIKYYEKRFISSDKEQANLLDYNDKLVNDELQSQWESSEFDNTHNYDPEKGWEYIEGNIGQPRQKGQKSKAYLTLVRYAVAASIIGLFILGAAVLLKQSQPNLKEEIYVYSTGKQDEKELILSDGTKVKLGAQSQLIYPSVFDGEKRIVKLNGVAFFDVTHNEKQPFEVEIENIKVKVLGTSFEIFENKESKSIETSLLTGKVEVSYKYTDNDKIDKYILKPNERLTLSLKDGNMQREEMNIDNYCAWRSYQGLQFINEKIENIIPRLERWYNTKIELKPGDYSTFSFSFKVKNEPIETILKLLSNSSGILYDIHEDENYNKTYILKTN